MGGGGLKRPGRRLAGTQIPGGKDEKEQVYRS